MWFFYTVIYSVFMAGANYIDEYLTAHNTTSKRQNAHQKIGGVLLMSSLTTFFGAGIIYLFFGATDTVSTTEMMIALL